MGDRVATRGPAVPVGVADGRVPTLDVLLAITEFPLLAAGYRAVIGGDADFRIAGAVEHRDRVVDEVARLAPDIVVVDVPATPPADAAPATTIRAIRAARPAARVLAIASPCGPERRSPWTDAGADGLLSRGARPDDVRAALRCLGRGAPLGSGPIAIAEPAAEAVPGVPEATGVDAFDNLSERAREVFRLAAIGHSSREIARHLGVSEETVHDDRALIMQRLGLHRRVDLLRYALRHGIVRANEL